MTNKITTIKPVIMATSVRLSNSMLHDALLSFSSLYYSLLAVDNPIYCSLLIVQEHLKDESRNASV